MNSSLFYNLIENHLKILGSLYVRVYYSMLGNHLNLKYKKLFKSNNVILITCSSHYYPMCDFNILPTTSLI